jgi:RNA polymerase sigma-70 factor (ECF subfamily)
MPKKGEMTDKKLVRLSLRDREAFAHIIDRYQDKLLRYIRRFSGLPHEDTEDVLQDAFIKMYRNLNSFDGDLSFSAWAYRIAHNEAVNHLRSHARHRTVHLETNDTDTLNLIAVIGHSADVAGDARKKDIAERVRRILATLPPRYREVLVLKYLEEKDYREISDIVRKPMGTVASLLNRAKAQFRERAVKHHLMI